MARRFITVAETPLFVRQASDVWDDLEREAFIEFIAQNPEEGRPDPGNRWCAEDSLDTARKRQARRRAGDLFLSQHRPPALLLMLYTKARQENLTAEEKKIVRKLAAILKS